MRGLRVHAGVAAIVLLVLAPVAGSALADDTTGRSTLEQTVTGPDPDGPDFEFLETREGEDHVVRDELADPKSGRKDRRESLAYLGQITDFQLADEESPARVEAADSIPPFNSAWRPQEAFLVHQTDFTIRQINRFDESPVKQGDGERAKLENAVMTGDLADSQQRNETDWVVQLLEGGVFRNGDLKSRQLDPNSGTNDFDGTACEGMERDSLGNPRKYHGVQDYGDYPGNSGDERFYDPNEPIGEYSEWPIYEDIVDKGQERFRIKGLEVPSYSAFGNHDGLVQGNAAAVDAFEEVGTGCLKFFPPAFPPGAFKSTAAAKGDEEALPDFTEAFERLADANAAAKQSAQGLVAPPAGAEFVPPDEQRQFVDHRQFKKLHDTGEQKDEHGFAYVDEGQLDKSDGHAAYYDFSPQRGIRYIVLDTISEGGVIGDSSSGNLDNPQFKWLERTLEKAQDRDELILTFGHHATGSLNAITTDEQAPACASDDEHGHDVNPGCDRDPRQSTPLHDGGDLEELFHQFPNMVSYIAGHSHENEVQPFSDGAGGGFWEIKTPAIADWPPQHRLIEVMDNEDGTLSIFGTLLDHDGPSKAPKSGDSDEVDAFSSAELSSVGRTLSFNDPQQGPGGPEGERLDRNVELLINDPRSGGSSDCGFAREQFCR